jgi:hypothetical protein
MEESWLARPNDDEDPDGPVVFREDADWEAATTKKGYWRETSKMKPKACLVVWRSWSH